MIHQIRAPPVLQLRFINASAPQKFPPPVVNPEAGGPKPVAVLLRRCQQFRSVRFVICTPCVIVWIRLAEIVGVAERPEVKELREWNLVDAPSFR